ncbi:MAG: hypothetical protein JSS23_11305 [Proteobacteria bacterium]|nr:hypothetical protein [Pseudomonadota bacterium]
MKNICLFAVALSCATSSAFAAKPVYETHSCDYTDLGKDITYSGRCHKQETEINGNFAYILTWPSGGRVTVEYVNSQSGNHIWKLNGKPAAAVEISREHLKGFSLDLNQLLEWQDRP